LENLSNISENRVKSFELLLNQYLITAGTRKIFEIPFRNIELWDMEQNFKNINQFPSNLEQGQRQVYALKSLTNQRLASACDQGKINIWNMSNHKNVIFIKKLQKNNETIRALAFISDDVLISAGNDKYITLWNLKTDELSFQIQTNHTGNIRSLLVLNDTLIATGSEDMSIRIWSIKNKYELTLEKTLYLNSSVFSLNIIQISTINYLISGTENGNVSIWSLNGDLFNNFKLDSSINIIEIFKNETIIIGQGDGYISVWNINGVLITKTNQTFERVESLKYFEKNNFDYLAAGYGDSLKTLIIWKIF